MVDPVAALLLVAAEKVNQSDGFSEDGWTNEKCVRPERIGCDALALKIINSKTVKTVGHWNIENIGVLKYI